MELIIYFLVIFFLVIGVCDLLHTIHIHLIMPHKTFKNVMVCKLDEGYLDEQIEYLTQQYKWYGSRYFDKCICLCDIDTVQAMDLELIEEINLVDKRNISKLYDLLGEEYGLNFRQH